LKAAKVAEELSEKNEQRNVKRWKSEKKQSKLGSL